MELADSSYILKSIIHYIADHASENCILIKKNILYLAISNNEYALRKQLKKLNRYSFRKNYRQ